MHGIDTTVSPAIVLAKDETVIVGFKQRDYGRECVFHSCCGSHIKCGTMVHFKREKYKKEEAVAVFAHLVSSEPDPCRVGWVAKDLIKNHEWEELEGMVTSFLKDSKKTMDRHQDYAKYGAAKVNLKRKHNKI